MSCGVGSQEYHAADSYAGGVRGTGDLHLLDTQVPELLREVTGLEPVASGVYVRLDQGAGVRSTQRLALGDVGGGIAALTWPGELKPQATYLYESGRAARLLEAVEHAEWQVDMRPHLAFWNSPHSQRLYMNPAISLEQYVEGWSGPDERNIGQCDANEIRVALWPWLRKRGYASSEDEQELDRFLARLGQRPGHLRPGLRLLRRWESDEVTILRERGARTDTIRTAVNRVLLTVGDPPLPVR